MHAAPLPPLREVMTTALYALHAVKGASQQQ
jgi:hypothetical protein